MAGRERLRDLSPAKRRHPTPPHCRNTKRRSAAPCATSSIGSASISERPALPSLRTWPVLLRQSKRRICLRRYRDVLHQSPESIPHRRAGLRGADLRILRISSKRSRSSAADARKCRPTRVLTEFLRGVKTRTGLCRHSNRSLFASGNSAGKRFGEARDRAAFLGDTSRFRAAETALSRVSAGKAAESQRLFRTR